MSKNIVVIGAGPAGEAVARKVFALGAKVTLIEKSDLGGLCLNQGCIPSKTLLETVRKLKNYKEGSAFGLQGTDLSINWPILLKRKEEVIKTIRDRLAETYKHTGIQLVTGQAQFNGDQEISVGGQTYPFDAAVIAVGSSPFFPPPFNEIRDQILDSSKILNIAKPPKSLVVIGGGAVGCEFACLLHEVGTNVTLIELTEGLLPGEDKVIRQALERSFTSRGIIVRKNTTVTKVIRKNNIWQITLSDNTSFQSEEILVCVGRRPQVQNINLERAGVQFESKGIPVNDKLQTNIKHIYAVGDVNGMSLLAHAGSAQGEIAAGNIMGESRAYDNAIIPRCLYTWPEVASCGEWRWSAESKNIPVKAQRFFFEGSGKALADGNTEGFIQVISRSDSKHILGAQIIGPHASEIIHIFSVAIAAGMTRDDLSRIVFAHPTLSEGIKEALKR